MLANTPKPLRGEELTYTRSVFEAILAAMGWDDPSEGQFVCTEEGARVKEVETAGVLAWHPLCEVMAPGSPNPLDEPWLPFPFTARQLAALMTDGWGYFIQDRFGNWEDGPNDEELGSVGMLGGKAKEALQQAYREYRLAAELAPRLDPDLEFIADELARQYGEARESAMASEKLREAGIGSTEYDERLARVNEAVDDLRQRLSRARATADLAHSQWRRAVVQHLLLGIEKVPVESFRSQILGALPPGRRAEALHQTRTHHEFMQTEKGKTHWELVCRQQEVEAEQQRWQSMRATNITEASLQDARLKELALEAEAIADCLLKLEEPLAQQTPEATSESKRRTPTGLDYSLLANREQLLDAFGSYGLKLSWFNDLNSRRWLLEARKVAGQGQRGHRRPPLFCPFEVMTGLTEKSRKSRLSSEAGWRLLEHKFPRVYAVYSVGDPRERTG